MADKPEGRRISKETYSLQPYEDNCGELEELRVKSGMEPGEALRILVDEALRARREPPAADRVPDAVGRLVEQNRSLVEENRQLVEESRRTAGRCERLLEAYELIQGQSDSVKRGLIQNLREFYGMLLEVLSASIGARRLAWNYVARTILKESGYTDAQIQQRYENEKRDWIEERERIVEALEKQIEKMDWPPAPEVSALEVLGYGSMDPHIEAPRYPDREEL
jgi:hypothetical protein